MAIDSTQKKEITEDHARHKGDTAPPEVQLALRPARTEGLTKHSKVQKKDSPPRTALRRLVAHRRNILNYLKSKDIQRYRALIDKLGLRK